MTAPSWAPWRIVTPPVPEPRTLAEARPPAVEYTAACPGCGADATWTGRDAGARTIIRVHCPCDGGAR